MNTTVKDSRMRSVDADAEPYAWEVVVDFGRPGLRVAVTMRDLIHWTAYRLDTGAEDYINNHRAAVLLRCIAEEFYPYHEDTADYIIEELQDAGCTDDFKFKERPLPAADVRLLDLQDGLVSVDSTFGETLWSEEERNPVLAFNAAKTIDFRFPTRAVERHGVVGIRICALDLVQWLRSDAQLHVMSFNSEESWLEQLDAAYRNSREVAETARSERMQARHGENWRELLSRPEEPSVSSEERAEEILRELDGLI